MDTNKTTAICTSVYDNMNDIMVELWNIYWDDGKKFKDFQIYENELKRKFECAEIEAEFVKATKRPFGIIYKVNGETIHLFCRRKGYKLDFISKIAEMSEL